MEARDPEPRQEGPQAPRPAGQGEVEAALQKLAQTDEGDIKRLTNVKPPEWRLRVGDIRVRFAYVEKDDVIVVLRVLPRGKAYDR